MTADFDISPGRFLLKKAIRRAAVSAGRALRALHPVEQPRVRVLMYHRFGGSRLDPVSVTVRAFRQHLALLEQHHHVVAPSAFRDLMIGAGIPASNQVLITIDDGHVSVFRDALPALDARSLRAILFVCPGLIDEVSLGRAGGTRHFMNWDEIGKARDRGHEIAPHGLTHRSLGQMPLSEAIEEIEQSTDLLKRRLGVRSTFFSLPFGTRLDFSGSLLAALSARGYQFCFSAIHGACVPSRPYSYYPRLKIEGGPEDDLFPHIASGCLDYWGAVDSVIYRFQQRGRL